MGSSVMQASAVRNGLRMKFWGSAITGRKLASMPSKALAKKINVLLRGPRDKVLVKLGPDNPKLDKMRMTSIQIAEILIDDAFPSIKLIEILRHVDKRADLFRDIATLDRQKAVWILEAAVNVDQKGREVEGVVEGLEHKIFLPSSVLDKGSFALSLLNTSSSWQERDFQRPLLGLLVHNSPEILREIIASASRRLYHPGMRSYYRFLLDAGRIWEPNIINKSLSEVDSFEKRMPRSIFLTDRRYPFGIKLEQTRVEMALPEEFESVHVFATLEKDDHLELPEIYWLLNGLKTGTSFLYKVQKGGELRESHATVSSVDIQKIEDLTFIQGQASVKIRSDVVLGARLLLETPDGEQYLILETEVKDGTYISKALYHLDLAYNLVGLPKKRGEL